MGCPLRTRARAIFLSCLSTSPIPCRPPPVTKPREHIRNPANTCPRPRPCNRFVMPDNLGGGLSFYGIYTIPTQTPPRIAKRLPPVIAHICKPDKKRPRLTRGGARLERVKGGNNPAPWVRKVTQGYGKSSCICPLDGCQGGESGRCNRSF